MPFALLFIESSGIKQPELIMSVAQSNGSPILVFATPQRKQWTEFAGRGELGIALRILDVPEVVIDKVMEDVVEVNIGVGVGVGVGVGGIGVEVGVIV